MSLDRLLLEQAINLVQAMDKATDSNLPSEIAEIVKFHSKGAAIASLGAAWIPGVGGIAAIVAGGGFIWTMYGRIGEKIDVPFSSNVLQSLASGVATNLAAYVVTATVVSTALSLVPVGNIGASVIMGGTCYAVTLASGFVYLKIMTNLFRKGIDPTTLSAAELQEIAKSVAKGNDVKEVIRKAKEQFKSKQSQGEFSGEQSQHAEPTSPTSGGLLGARNETQSDARTNKWFYLDNDQDRHGPVSSRELVRLIRTGEVTETTRISRDGNSWSIAARLKLNGKCLFANEHAAAIASAKPSLLVAPFDAATAKGAHQAKDDASSETSQIVCPYCSGKLAIASSNLGSEIRCLHCARLFRAN